MKRTLFSLSVLLFSFWAWAQGTSPITISRERTSKGEVIFWAENTVYAPYTVTLTFSKLSNTSSVIEGEPLDAVVAGRGRYRILSLRPSTENSGIGFSYSSMIRKGDSRAKVDTNFVYLLPLPKGKPVRTRLMVSLDGVLGKSDKAHMTGIAVETQEGDTITAARGGIVTEIQDHSASIGENKSFSSTENYVEVYHKDGSFARYKLFKNGGIFLQEGDEIIPGQAMGIIGGDNYKQGSHLRFSLFTPIVEKKAFVPSFYLGGGKIGKPENKEMYASEHPEEIVMLEMSKKEKKRYMERR